MANPFFEHPILNSPYECPGKHWELDAQGQPTQQLIETRRRAEFISPIPKPKKRKSKSENQGTLSFDEGAKISTQQQQYATSLINGIRGHVDAWRKLSNPSEWQGDPGNRAAAAALANAQVCRCPPVLLSGGSRRDSHLADRGRPSLESR